MMFAIASSLAASIVLKVTVITALSLIAAWLARGNRAAVRHALLAAAFVVILLLPITSAVAPPVQLALPVAVENRTSAFVPSVSDSDQTPPVAVVADDPGDPVTSVPQSSGISLPTLLLAIWIVGGTIFLLPLVIGVWQVRLLRRSGLPWRQGQSLAEAIALDAGVHRRVQVLLNEEAPGPMTCGIVHPTILLPQDAESWNEEDLKRAFIHELEHIRRVDTLSHTLARGACAVYWFHPLVWIPWRRLALEAERACDDAVLRRSEATAYADQLVKLAKRLHAARRSPLLAMAERAYLATRVRAVLDARQRRGRAGALPVGLVTTAAIVVVISMSSLILVAAPQAAAAQTTKPQSDAISVKPVDRQSSDSPPRFDATEVHPSPRATNPWTLLSGGALRGERYELRKATMIDLIRIAFGVDSNRIVGGPRWLEFDRFDITGRAPASTSPNTTKLMLQSLLADRFHLAAHHETRPVSTFVLAAGKSVAKLKPVDGSGEQGCHAQPQTPPPYIGYSCRSATMAMLARMLSGAAADYLTNPVADMTGLDGAWDFDLRWIRRSQTMPPNSERTTIFDAVENQLGLTLTLQDVGTSVLVVDRVDEVPTPNAPNIGKLLAPRVTEFEVADVKLSRQDEKRGFRVTPGGGLDERANSLRILIATAWDIDWDHSDSMIVGPKFLDSTLIDINAKASTTTNGPAPSGSDFLGDDLRLMLKSLLIDRFKMATHFEDRPTQAYTLVAARPKMNKADPRTRSACKEAQATEKDPRDSNPQLSRLVQCRNVTMAQFAHQLQILAPDYLANEVLDGTGLSGAWDFDLSFSRASQLDGGATGKGVVAEAGSASEPVGGLSLFDAVHRQLGLKLESRKRMLPTLVIDRIESQPQEN